MNTDLRSEVAKTYAEFCKGLGNTSRLLIVYALADHSMNVGTLAKTIGLSQSTTSHNLKTLLDQGVVRSKRDGQNVLYTLADVRLVQALDMIWLTMADQLGYKATLSLNKLS